MGPLGPSVSDPRRLVYRIERAEAEQMSRTPQPGPAGTDALPEVIEVGGGRAVFFGAGSPHSAALGVGLAAAVGSEDVDRIEAHLGRGGAVRIQVTPFSHPTLARELGRRGYRVGHFHLVWYRPPCATPPPEGLEIRPLHAGEERAWAEIFFHAFAGRPAASDVDLQPTLALTRAASTCFLALVEGSPSAAAIGSVCERVALLSGDAVSPEKRGRGLQAALIRARLAWAEARGCDLVAAATDPATPSQRNYEKEGFRCAYPRAIMVRDPLPG
jgi:GNAT superfamily N-acetyltransferase